MECRIFGRHRKWGLADIECHRYDRIKHHLHGPHLKGHLSTPYTYGQFSKSILGIWIDSVLEKITQTGNVRMELDLTQPGINPFSAKVHDSTYKSATSPTEWPGVVRQPMQFATRMHYSSSAWRNDTYPTQPQVLQIAGPTWIYL